jgi:hypothetical protein
MKTKTLSLLAALALLAPSATAGATAGQPVTKPYSDVAPGITPHALAIYELTALGVVRGFPGGTFQPNSPLTRAQFAVMALGTVIFQPNNVAAEAAYLVHKTTTPPGGYGCYPGTVGSGGALCPAFTDVPPSGSAWYVPAVYLAAKDGLVHGFPDGTFRPDQGVTLQEALTVAEQELIRAAALNVGGNSPLASLVGAGMTGVSWGQVPAVAEQSGLLAGLTDRSWSQPIDRAQAAQILADLLGANVGTAANPAPYVDGTAGAGFGLGAASIHYLYLSASAPGYVATSPVEYLTGSDTPRYEIADVTTTTGGATCPQANCGGGSVVFLSSAPLSPIPPADTAAPAPLPPASLSISGGAPIVPGQPIQLTATFTAALRNVDGQPVTALPAGDSIVWQITPADTGATVTPTGPLTASVTLPASPPGTWLLDACVQSASGCSPISNILTLTNSLG